MNILAIITARKGSKRLKKKNIKILGRKPLINWTIDFAKSTNFFDDILITTDDYEILDIAKKKNILAPWLRPKNLSTDKASSYSAVIHALRWYERNRKKIDCICLLQPTSPFRSKKNLKDAFKIFRQTKKSVISVMKKKVKNPLSQKKNENKHFNIYIPSGSFFLISPKDLKLFKNFINRNNYLYLINNPKENIDINDLSDWKLAKSFIN